MKSITIIVWVLVLLFLAIGCACKLWGVPLPDPVGVLALPFVAYLWVYDWPGWKRLGGMGQKPNTPKDSGKPKTDPPRGYTGPFWNKPSGRYLESNAQAESGTFAFLCLFLLVVPFGALVYILLR
jgi:hypothetical protein